MWVLCGGMERSGSTLQYQLAKEIVETAGLGEGKGWVNDASMEELIRTKPDDRYYVIKSHAYLKSFDQLPRKLCVYSYRDARDVVVSLMRKNDKTFDEVCDWAMLQKLVNNFRKWTSLDQVHIAKYETFNKDLETATGQLAAFLGAKELNASQVASIAAAFSIDAQKKRMEAVKAGEGEVLEIQGQMVSGSSLLHSNHIQSGESGDYEQYLTRGEIAFIEHSIGAWMTKNGYPLTIGKLEASCRYGWRRLKTKLSV